MARFDRRRGILATPLGAELVRVLVGPEQREFSIHKKMLCSSSAYFRDSIEAVPAALSTTPDHDQDLVIWLSGECPQMFELFVLWLYERHAFRTLLDDAITAVTPAKENPRCRALHWNLVRLHLFAALIDIPALQDYSLDAIQDLYLRCDWDMPPRLLQYLYAEAAPDAAARLRKWALAMTAWTLSNNEGTSASAAGVMPPPDSPFAALFTAYPDLADEYEGHLARMASTRADVRIKNPQLRIPANRLRSEERHFGFRQCSFHSHRRTVGEGRCPLSEKERGRPAVLLLSPVSEGGSSSGEEEEGGWGKGGVPALLSPLRSKPQGRGWGLLDEFERG